MDKENKDLLLRDLCVRLPYGVRCSFGVDDAIYEINGINPTCCGASEIQATHIKSGINGDFILNACKPYLFPLSSMDKKQRKYIRDNYTFGATHELFEWFDKNHYDYRGLIPMGLALDATDLNIY